MLCLYLGVHVRTPDQVVLQRNLITDLALHVNVLGLNLAHLVNLGHHDLPSDSVLDLTSLGLHW